MLHGTANAGAFRVTIGIDTSVLTSWYAARYGVGTTATASTTAAAQRAPTPPWGQATETATVSALTQSVLNGGAFITPGAAKLDAPATAASSSDYRNLFALYQGLSALNGLAQQAQSPNLPASQAAQLQSRFAAGLKEVQGFLSGKPFTSLSFADGASGATSTAKTGLELASSTYTGRTAATGASSTPLSGLDPDAKFSATVTRTAIGGTSTPVQVNFDLSEMGDTPRSLSAVVSYMNGKFAAAGVVTRVSVQRTAGAANTTTVNGQTVSLGGSAPDKFAITVNGSSAESLSFSAPHARPAVYLAQTAGTTTGDAPTAVQQLLKFDPAAGTADGADRTFGQTLPAGLGAVRATATGPDGSVYLLADVTGPTPDGQAIKGSGDVALVRYDGAGQLDYVQTLGAANSASGLALAVSADGKEVAVAGAAVGDLDRGDAPDATQAASFVQVFGSNGDALWSTRGPVGQQPQAVAFAADGSVVVSGATHTDLGLPGAQGAFLQSYAATDHTAFDGTDLGYKVTTTSAADPGARGEAPSGLATLPDGRIATASVENGHAVLRVYAGPLTTGAQPQAVRDLGDLGGGSIAGLAVGADGSLVVAGTSGSGALDAGTATTSYSGGREAFVAKVSADLQPSAADTLSYVDLGGSATVSSLAVSGGQVVLAAQVAGAPVASGDDPSHATVLAAVDPSTGEVAWSDRASAIDGQGAPTSVAVAAQGSSALDALGLPSGAINAAPSTLVTTGTSARAGDSLTVQVGAGATTTVTLEAADTLASLAQKINRAAGYNLTASVSKSSGENALTLAAGATPVTLAAGPQGSDLLKALGLSSGIVQTASTARNTKNSVQALPYALNIGTALSLASTTTAKSAQGALQAAMATVQRAYTALITPPASTTSTASTASTAASAYTQGRIADYQLALARLTGSS